MMTRQPTPVTLPGREWLFFFFLFAVVVISAEVFTGSACADDMRGIAELVYSHTSSKNDSGNGNVSSFNADDFLQQYVLTLTKTLYPNLTLFANGIFEEDLTTTRADTGDTKSRTTTIQPLITLTLNTSPFSAVATYNKQQITTNTSGSSPETTVIDNYSGLLSYKPEGLPELDVTAQRTEAYDPQRALQDTLVNRLVVYSMFTPVRNLNLNYQLTYNDTDDKIHNVDTTQIVNSGTFTYSRPFFNNRVSLYSDGYFTRQDTTATIGPASTGAGVLFIRPAVSGLYAGDSTADSPLGVDEPPHTPANDAMRSSPFLVNGGDFLGNVGKVNIGFPQTNPGDINPRDVGFSFGQPVELSAIYVTVNQDVSRIAGSYSWDVYFSNDTTIAQQGGNPAVTQQWTLYQKAATFTFSEIDNTFRITFQKVTAQFFKVVTTPLPVPASVPGVDVNNILITQLQAFDTTTASNTPINKTTTTMQSYDLNLRTRILDSPVLYYDMTSYYSRTSNTGSGFAVGQPSQVQYIIHNGLSGSYRFNNVFSTGAMIAREELKEPYAGHAYIYNASLTATPVGTMTNSLVFSSRQETDVGLPNDTASLFLTNLAELYKGINVAFSGGESWSTSTTFQKNDSDVLNFTLSLVPYKTLTINGNFSWTNSKITGGGVPNIQTTSEQSNLAFTYAPFPTLSLFGSFGVFSGVNVQQNTLTSYGVNWSPFPDGALLFNFTCNQDLASLNSAKDTTIVPTLRWNVSQHAYMTISYLAFKSESVITSVPQHSSQNTLSVVFYVLF